MMQAAARTALAIEDYALIGDCITAALVGRDGSIDWLCWPRFDSAACFAALLGTECNGRFLIAPANPGPPATRCYRDGSLVLETVFDTPGGQVALIDFMVPGSANSCIVAAPTTSLPEALGGVRNWDYRYCWLRDATITLYAFMGAGYFDEAAAWADWLQRSVAGRPDQVQIMYGIAGERRLDEWEAAWLPGYQGAAPVRIGNAAADQLQLDVYGEVMSSLHRARNNVMVGASGAWSLQRALLEHLDTIWQQPDEGMWETRGGRRHFTFSKVMAWVAFDRGIRDVELHGLEAPVDQWRATRDRIHETVCREGFDAGRNSFVQSFGAKALDATLLLIPIVGFLPHDDPRVVGTVAAIERELVVDGFVLRYRTDESGDGLPPGEGAFLACSFWLAMTLHLQGRTEDAKALFERLLTLQNDVGLLAEEYDPRAGRFTGNFPQAFSHVALVTAAMVLAGHGPAHEAHKADPPLDGA